MVGDCELFPERSGLERREKQQRLCSVRLARSGLFGGFGLVGLLVRRFSGAGAVLDYGFVGCAWDAQQQIATDGLSVPVGRAGSTPALHSEPTVEFGVVGQTMRGAHPPEFRSDTPSAVSLRA